jgi:hypothetical protein
MKIEKRMKLAQEAGPQYSEIAQMFEAATTGDVAKLKEFRNSPSAAIRFATFCNRYVEISLDDLDQDFSIKFAAVFNSSTLTEVLDQIGLNQSYVNPVIPDAIKKHGNASEEFAAYYVSTYPNRSDELYADEDEKYFIEAIYDFEEPNFTYGKVKKVIDLESLEALFYLYILGFIESPGPTTEFWTYFDYNPKNLEENVELFGSLPAIPKELYNCEAVVGARCLAGFWTKSIELMNSLSWDTQLVYTGVGGCFWQDSRSPRSSVAANENAPAELLRKIFEEELNNIDGLSEFPHPVFWRLSCNESTPMDVLEGIVKSIEEQSVTDEMTQEELLVGHVDDYPFGLITNPSLKGELRIRVKELMLQRGLNPKNFNN